MPHPIVEYATLNGDLDALIAPSDRTVFFHLQWWDNELGMYCRSQQRLTIDGLMTHNEKLKVRSRHQLADLEIMVTYCGQEFPMFYPFDAKYLNW